MKLTDQLAEIIDIPPFLRIEKLGLAKEKKTIGHKISNFGVYCGCCTYLLVKFVHKRARIYIYSNNYYFHSMPP